MPGGSGGSPASGTGGNMGTGGSRTDGGADLAAGAGGSGAGGAAAGGASGRADAGGTAAGGASGSGGAGGTAMGGASGGGGGAGGTARCAARALSLSANGTASLSDAALAHVEVDLQNDLPIGNAQRSIEFWAFIRTTDWVGEKNELYYYGAAGSAASFGLDFGTNPITGTTNHATLNPFTGGGFNDDSAIDLGINSSTDQWVHIAMTWNGTVLVTYVNGVPKITTPGSAGITALATARSVLNFGCNPTNNSCFGGLFAELRVWNVARTAAQILASYNKPLVGNEAGLVGYWKLDDAPGATTAADAVTTTGHTAHAGTLKADTAAHTPTFVPPPTPLPLVCP